MSVLVTGSEGFIGKYLTEFFRKNRIRFYSMGLKSLNRGNHFKISSVLSDREIQKVLKITNPEFIFHLAGSPKGNEEELNQVNFQFGKKIIENSKKISLTKTKLVFFGTSAEYGFIKKENLPFTEDFLEKPISLYGTTKLKQTNFLLNEDHALDYLIVRPFNVYGSGMPDYLSLSNFINQLKKVKKSSSLKQNYLDVGNLEVKRDFIYIDDFINALWKLSQTKKAYGQIFNVCSCEPLSLEKIVNYMVTLTGQNIIIRQKKDRLRQNDMEIHYGDNKKMINTIGDLKFTSWKKGIKNMWL